MLPSNYQTTIEDWITIFLIIAFAALMIYVWFTQGDDDAE